MELKCVLNKNAFYYSYHWEHDNAFHWELMVCAETVMLQHANKILWSSTKESSSFSSFLRQLHQIVAWQVSDFVLCVIMARCGPNNYFFNWDFKEKHKSMFRLPQNGRGVLSHQTSLVKNFTFLLPPRKQDDWCAFKWVLITNHRFKAASCTFVKKNDNVQHYFEGKFDFWNISKATTDWLKRSMAKLKLSH